MGLHAQVKRLILARSPQCSSLVTEEKIAYMSKDAEMLSEEQEAKSSTKHRGGF